MKGRGKMIEIKNYFYYFFLKLLSFVLLRNILEQ